MKTDEVKKANPAFFFSSATSMPKQKGHQEKAIFPSVKTFLKFLIIYLVLNSYRLLQVKCKLSTQTWHWSPPTKSSAMCLWSADIYPQLQINIIDAIM